jgi:hypothetical protein
VLLIAVRAVVDTTVQVGALSMFSGSKLLLTFCYRSVYYVRYALQDRQPVMCMLEQYHTAHQCDYKAPTPPSANPMRTTADMHKQSNELLTLKAR